MGRIYKDCYETVRETGRELQACGLTVPVRHYQNIPLEGESQKTKELVGVGFIVTRPWEGQHEALRLMYGDEAPAVAAYIRAETADRASGRPLNPGNSWKSRLDLWQALMSKDPAKDGRFDYTYAERLALRGEGDQIQRCAVTLAEDPASRRAAAVVFWPEDTAHATGAQTRVPCTMGYQFLIRQGVLHTLYHIRSNDFYKHFIIDVILAHRLGEEVSRRLAPMGVAAGPGPLHYFCGSLHAYTDDLARNIEF